MIVVDSSALIAVVMNEAEASSCESVLIEEGELIMSAANLTEALIVASQRGLVPEVEALIEHCAIEVVPVDEIASRYAASAYVKWGKGYHPARLNYGDCFAYALAKERGCPLLFIGNDFSQTDILSAL